ncbi:MAG: response regulator [Pseudanabaenaceae cyanobacterium bins.68]|nr:response regulator [Pseudanabaenaceae cyanobacterium bins.68]
MKRLAIICIDDEKVVLDTLRLELEKVLGGHCLIEVAESGQEALEVLAELLSDDYEVAVAISDYIMPGIKGDELLKQIHQLSPKTLNILLTGQADAHAVGNAVNQAQLHRYIAKPWNGIQLSETITAAVYRYFQDQHLAKKNQELADLNHQLVIANQQQMDLICQLHDTQKSLTEANRTLEAQVKMRTEELQQELKEYKQAESLAIQASRAKSNFLATMSHEIRTPMNGILGTAELLATSSLTPPQQDLVQTLRYSAESLLKIINSILDFSKLESQEILLEQIPFDLIDCIEATIELLSPEAEQKGISLCLLFLSSMPTDLIGDPSRLRQILLNLVSNGIKFTNIGEVRLEVDLKYENSSSAQIQFRVIDTGIGISNQARDRLFQPFTQAELSTSRIYGGTGLGLAIAKQLVELMGGTISVQSQLGEGTEFTFTAQFARQTRSHGAIFAIHPQLQNQTLLILERHSSNRRVISLYAQTWGMNVIYADRLSSLEDQAWQVGIGDLEMIDHLACSSCIPGQVWQKPWLVTANPSQSSKFNPGRYHCLVKPIKIGKLQAALLDVQLNLMPELPSGILNINPPALTSANLARARILVVDDNAINCKVVVRQLEALGYAADSVSNGEIALNQWHQQAYDLILMDCQMPVMDGYEATRRIRQIEQVKPTKAIPIIGLTADAMEGAREKCLAAGMNDYLSKPVRVERLGTTIKSWL